MTAFSTSYCEAAFVQRLEAYPGQEAAVFWRRENPYRELPNDSALLPRTATRRRLLDVPSLGPTLPGKAFVMDQQSDSVDRNDEQPEAPKWRVLNRVQRRILGVLVEKAKTTPEAYPLSLNAITTGSNQKSNRAPQMSLEVDDVEVELDNLRSFGAVIEVQAGGRVPKYKHLAYEWFGVDKFELAVITELLLRGEQTIGELRGRAARMEPIADLNTLKPIIQSLVAKGLMVELTPAGRGQVVSHALYSEREMNDLRAQFAGGAPAQESTTSSRPSAPAARPVAAPPAIDKDEFIALQEEVADLRELVEQLRADLEKVLS